jgi:hypothetical protein
MRIFARKPRSRSIILLLRGCGRSARGMRLLHFRSLVQQLNDARDAIRRIGRDQRWLAALE